MAACCPPGSLGAAPLSSEKAIGRMERIESLPAASAQPPPLECYVTGKPLAETKRIILLFTDVYGIDSGHHKVVADRLAADLSETTVVVPDFFRGNPILRETLPWLPRQIVDPLVNLPRILYNCKFRVTDVALNKDLLEVVIPWLKEQTTSAGGGASRDVAISCVGFCFGGWLTAHTLALSNTQDLPIQCGFGIHPSFRIEQIFGRKDEDLARAVGTRPILLLPAKNDELKPGKHEAVKILAQARGVPQDEVSILFPTMIHGWVTRGDSNVAEVREQQDKALKLTVDFIQRHHPIEVIK